MKIPLLWAAPLLRIIYELWSCTLRYTVLHRHRLNDLLDADVPVCLALWHNELFPLMHLREKGRFAAIVSQSSDGELLARVLEHMDILTARGSSSRGGVRAMLKAAHLMRKQKRVVCVTVDGPRGPRHEVKEGIIHLARLGKGKIVPVRLFMNRCKRFASWDRFQLPLPFSKIEVNFGQPYDPHLLSASGKPEAKNETSLMLAAQELHFRLEEIQPEKIKVVL